MQSKKFFTFHKQQIVSKGVIMIFRLGELFSGPGGLAYGLKNANVVDGRGNEYSIEHVWANDIDEDSCKTFQKNIVPNYPNKVIIGHVDDLDIKNLAPIDAFAYGFPCNDFSLVGEHNGLDGKYSPLYSYGIEVLNYHNPFWFFAENVGGIRSANDGEAFRKITTELENAGRVGYQISIHLFKFEEYGIPQKRHRIIIVGFRKDLGIKFKVPAPTTPDPNNQISAKKVLENPPIPKDAPNHRFTKHQERVVKRLEKIPPGGNAWHENVPPQLRLNVAGAKLSQIYRRLEPNKPSYTITGNGGGGTYGYHWEEPRALTNRERARLQTFPDDFIFIGGKGSVRSQIGMAVPPKGAKIIIEAIIKCFAGINYKSVPENWGNSMNQLSLDLD